MKILVIEDEAGIRESLARMLRFEGHQVLEAWNGKTGLAQAQAELPELIVSDVTMPELDGYGLLERLRADARTAAIPFIFLTARSGRDDMRKGMALGADDYLWKPFTRDELLAAIAARVQRRQTMQGPVMAAPTSPGSVPNGQPQVKGYRLVKKLGRGGMSQVWLAERGDGGEVALKLFDVRVHEDPRLLHRFIQEYALLAQIEHPNVARIYEQGFADEHVYIAMEYFPAGDIRAALAAGLSEAQALDWTRQVASALVPIHAHGIVHRDLKPANLMRRADGTLALIDFGVAKHLTDDLEQTRTGEVVGSPYYLSPEQAAGRAVSLASDVYSLGLLCYEFLTGRRAYQGETLDELVRQHQYAPLPELPPALAQYRPLMAKLCAKDPTQRLANAGAALIYLQTRHARP